MSDVSISAKRTAVNTSVVLILASIVSQLFGWEINLSDSGVYVASVVLGVIVGIGYRLSRWATHRWPVLGWVLFGSGKEPEGMKPIGQ